MVIAIKGKIGTGKSSISKRLKELYDVNIINADEIVAHNYKNNNNLISEINNTFNLSGKEVDKKELGKIVFESEEELVKLENIVHPFLEEVINNEIIDNDISVIDAQIIDKLNIKYDFSIICVCKEDVIIDRIINRDLRNEDQIRAILKLQEESYILEKKGYVIDTTEGVNEELLIKIFDTFKKEYSYMKK